MWSKVERIMGPVQKIFYFHVGSAWNAYVAFFVVFIFSILYLITKKRTFDIIAGVSGEIGVMFTAIVLITGPIWGRSAWNTWWTWEPRLTTTLILFFMYVAYLVLWQLSMEWQKKARLTSVFGIISFINVPIVYLSIHWWGSQLHPDVIKSDGGSALETSMTITLIFTVMMFTFLYLSLLQQGTYVEKLRLTVKQLKMKIQEEMMN